MISPVLYVYLSMMFSQQKHMSGDVSCVVSHSKVFGKLFTPKEFYFDLYCTKMSIEPISSSDFLLTKRLISLRDNFCLIMPGSLT